MSLTSRLYSFADFQAYHPKDQPPGDRLDAQFDNHRQAIETLDERLAELRRSDGLLRNGIVTIDALAASLIEQIVGGFMQQAAGALESSAGSARSAAASSGTASLARINAENAAMRAEKAFSQVSRSLPGLLNSIEERSLDNENLKNHIQARWIDVLNDAKDAEGWGNYAYSWAQVSWRWAEWMEGPIPSDILAIMGISGEHWSAAFWANQAHQSAEDVVDAGNVAADSAIAAAASASSAATSATSASASAATAESTLSAFSNLYYGPHASAPTLDPAGGAITEGDLFFNTSTNELMVWDGAAWQAVSITSGSGGPASAVSFTPTGGIASTNVQAALVELDTEKLTDAASDGTTYGRKNGSWFALPAGGGLADAPSDGKAYSRLSAAWVQNNASSVTWTPTIGVTTPVFVSAELDAVRTKNAAQDTSIAAKADSSSVTSSLALKADKTYVDSQDTALQGDITSEASTRASADTTLQTNINAKASTSYVDSQDSAEASARAAADNLRALLSNNLSDLPNPGTARSNLGLGTAAVQAIGTSGANVPLLSTANTWTLQQTMTVRPVFNGNTPWDAGNLVTPLKADTTNQSITGGTRITTYDNGTKSSSTFTPDPGNGPHQKYTNNGAHVLAPDTTNVGDYILDVTNGASAGAITVSSWTKTGGDPFNTTNGNKFRCFCSVNSVGSTLSVMAMQ